MRRLMMILLFFALIVQVAPAPAQDQATGPAIWFAPFPPLPEADDRPFVGTEDFMALFDPEAEWQRAAAHTDVFQFFPEWLAWNASDEEVAQVVAGLEAWDLRMAVWVAPISNVRNCASEGEIAFRLGETERIIERVQAAGGSIDFAGFDLPFSYGVYFEDTRCNIERDRLLNLMQQHAALLRGAFPDIKIGDFEAVLADADIGAYVDWLDAYEAATGETFAFFHAVPDFNVPGWPGALMAMADATHERGIPFGVAYTGENVDDANDYIFLMQSRISTLEGLEGWRPDHALFVSWHDQPDYALPDTEGHTFTNLIDRYANPRPQIEARLATHPLPGAYRVEGRLLGAEGEPLAGLEVKLYGRALVQTGIEVPEGDLDADVTNDEGYFRFDVWDMPGLSLELRVESYDTDWPARTALTVGQVSPNVAYQREVRASRAADEALPANAVDGTEAYWSAGSDAPQWIQIALDEPTPFVGMQLLVAQDPPGDTRHRVWAIRDDGTEFMVTEFAEYTEEDSVLTFALPLPLQEITVVRVETVESPSWVAWKEIEIYAAPVDGHACVLRALYEVDILGAPDGESIDTLEPDQHAVIEGRTVHDGYIMWKLYGAAWLHNDDVVIYGNCLGLPVIHYPAE